jgi:hypothetical protein
MSSRLTPEGCPSILFKRSNRREEFILQRFFEGARIEVFACSESLEAFVRIFDGIQ